MKFKKRAIKKVQSFTFTGGIRELIDSQECEEWDSFFDLPTTGGAIGVSVLYPRASYWKDGGGEKADREKADRIDRDCAEQLATEIANFLARKGFRIPYREDYDPNKGGR